MPEFNPIIIDRQPINIVLFIWNTTNHFYSILVKIDHKSLSYVPEYIKAKNNV